MNPEHLGDGAYVRFEEGSFVLYTHNGIEETNAIYLEIEAMLELIRFARATTDRIP